MYAGCGEQPLQRDVKCPTVSVPRNPVRKKPAQRVLGDHMYTQWGSRPREKNLPKTSGPSEWSWSSPLQQLPLCQGVSEPGGALEPLACQLPSLHRVLCVC